MDDPWGSPWTSADRNSEASPPPPDVSSPFETILPLPDGDKILSLPAQSPWAEDEDGFGDWTVADVSTATPVYSTASRGLPASNISVSDEQPHASTASTSGLKTHQHSIHDIAVPCLATDHWNTDFTSTEGGFHRTLKPTSEPGGAISSVQHSANGDEHIKPGVRTNGVDTRDLEHNGVDPCLNLNNIRGAGESLSSEQGAGRLHKNENRVQPHPRHSIEDDNSNDQQCPVEDFNTSSYKQNLQLDTTESPKVDELVPNDSLSHISQIQSHNESERGDLCAGVVSVGTGLLGTTAYASCYDEGKCPDEICITAIPKDNSRSSLSNDGNYITIVEHPAGSGSRLIDRYGSMGFTLDQEKILVLFGSEQTNTPGIQNSLTKPFDAQDCQVSDHVTTDSFVTIGERKTWYRLSRKGSCRKHNMEDDDNYRTVSWVGSVVRSETVKIVRRWMEEDSFTGKPVLGLSGNRGNLFGWDSVTKPVALDEIFKKVSPTSSGIFSPIRDHLQLSPNADSSSRIALSNNATIASPGASLRDMWACSDETQEEAKRPAVVREAPECNEDRLDSSRVPDSSTEVVAGALSRNAETGMSGTGPGQWNGTQNSSSAKEEDEWGEMVSPDQDSSMAVLEKVLPLANSSETLPDASRGNGTPATRGSGNEQKGLSISKPAISQHKRDVSVAKMERYHKGFGWENGVANATTRDDEGLIQSVVYGLPDLSYMEK